MRYMKCLHCNEEIADNENYILIFNNMKDQAIDLGYMGLRDYIHLGCIMPNLKEKL